MQAKYFIAEFINRVIYAGLIFYIAKLFVSDGNSEAFGLYSVMLSIFGFLYVVDGGISNLIISGLSRKEVCFSYICLKIKNWFLKVILPFSIILSLIFYFVYKKELTQEVMLYFNLAVIFSLLTIYSKSIYLSVNKGHLISILEGASGLIFLIYINNLEMISLLNVLKMQVFLFVITAFPLLFLLLKKRNIKKVKLINVYSNDKSRIFMIIQIGMIFLWGADLLIISNYSLEMTALISIYIRFSQLINIPVNIFCKSYWTYISKNKNVMLLDFLVPTLIILTSYFVLIIGFYLFKPYIINYFGFEKEFISNNNLLFLFLMLNYLFVSLITFSSMIFNSKNKPEIQLFPAKLSFIVFIIKIIMLHQFGIYSFYYISMFLLFLINVYYWKDLKENYIEK